jgi:hypothetical protein
LIFNRYFECGQQVDDEVVELDEFLLHFIKIVIGLAIDGLLDILGLFLEIAQISLQLR